MFKNKKHVQYYVITFIYVTVFSTTYTIGVGFNPNFSIFDFCMGFASELLGLVFAIVIVDSYIKIKTERIQGKRKMKNVDNTSNLTAIGFEILSGVDAVKSVSTLRDTQTGVQYLFVVYEDGSGLTPLLDKDGKPIIEVRN